MSTDTLFNSLTRALALEPEAVYDDHANAFLPVLAATKKRPIVSIGAVGNSDGFQRVRVITADRDGGRTSYDDGHVVEPREVRKMKHAFETTPLRQHYLSRVVYQHLDVNGLAVRVQDAFGLGHLYSKIGAELVFLPERSIPSHLVREALQTTALDRIVAEAIYAESALAADRHLAGDPVCPELRYIPQGCLTQDVQAAYLAILRGVLKTPGYRDQVGNELSELF